MLIIFNYIEYSIMNNSINITFEKDTNWLKSRSFIKSSIIPFLMFQNISEPRLQMLYNIKNKISEESITLCILRTFIFKLLFFIFSSISNFTLWYLRSLRSSNIIPKYVWHLFARSKKMLPRNENLQRRVFLHVITN